jgi:hypothetical protein
MQSLTPQSLVKLTHEQIYDYLLMFNLEITMIWNQRWTYTKVLFILSRFSASCFAVLQHTNIDTSTGIYQSSTCISCCTVSMPLPTRFRSQKLAESDRILLDAIPEKCYWSVGVESCEPTPNPPVLSDHNRTSGLVMAGIVLAEIILAIRTWAVCYRDPRVGYLLVVLQLVNLFITSVYTNKLVESLVSTLPRVGIRKPFLFIQCSPRRIPGTEVVSRLVQLIPSGLALSR